MAAGALAVVGVGATAFGLAQGAGGLPQPPVPPAALVSPAAVTGPRATGASQQSTTGGFVYSPPPAGPSHAAALPSSRPVRIVIPRMHLDTGLVAEHLDPSGALTAPARGDQVGWYDGAPTPGATGPAIVEGHVTYNGRAVFYELGDLRVGDTVSVTRADGRTAVFTVTSSKVYPKSRFPTADVYGNLDYPGLRLITCGGRYDRAHHEFPGNLVVFAVMTSTH